DLEKLFNLLERLAIAFEQNVLSKTEMKHFEWYFCKAAEDPVVRDYCADYFSAVLTAAKTLGFPRRQDQTPQPHDNQNLGA
ncbi:MAG: hypothetical protein AAF961_15195, partial [Planctomycetota bacterium]